MSVSKFCFLTFQNKEQHKIKRNKREMKLSVSTSSLHFKQNATMQLHDFKMNIGKTLNSNFLQQFNAATNKKVTKYETKKKKKQRRTVTFSKVSTPCIPVKVNSNLHTMTTCHNSKLKLVRQEIDVTDNSSNESDLDLTNDEIYSAYFSPVIEDTGGGGDSSQQPTPQSNLNTSLPNMNISLNHSISMSSNSSMNTLNIDISQSDSGLSSLNSAQLFFAEIREYLVKDFAERTKETTKKLNEKRFSKCEEDSSNSTLFASSSLLSLANKISNQIYQKK